MSLALAAFNEARPTVAALQCSDRREGDEQVAFAGVLASSSTSAHRMRNISCALETSSINASPPVGNIDIVVSCRAHSMSPRVTMMFPRGLILAQR